MAQIVVRLALDHFSLYSEILLFIILLASTRSYSLLKILGDGSFGTVWLCDWHSTLPPNTPLSPMQCSAGAKPEWAGKRLVAVKRMKKRWEDGWDECKKLKELEVGIMLLLSTSSPHHSIMRIRLCAQYLFIRILRPFTTPTSSQIPKNFTSSSSPWKGTSTTL